MNCCNEDHPDCCHLVKHSGYWRCKIHGDMTIITQPSAQGCHYYEMPWENSLRVALQESIDGFDEAIEEHDAWRARCMKRGVYASIVVFVAYALFLWWII